MNRLLLVTVLSLGVFLAPFALAHSTEVLVVVTSEDHVAIGSGAGVRYEKKTDTQRAVLNFEEKKVSPHESELGRQLARSGRYAIKGGYLAVGTHTLGRATHLLAQAEVGGEYVLVYQRGAASVRSPLGLLMALSGHPEQVEEVWVAVIEHDIIKWSQRLLVVKSSRVQFGAVLYEKAHD